MSLARPGSGSSSCREGGNTHGAGTPPPKLPLPAHQAVTWFVCKYGLRMVPHQLASGELKQLHSQARKLLIAQDGVPLLELCQAIRYGMPRLWPFTENGFFDGRDVVRNITKAKAIAANMRQQGTIPITYAEAVRREAKLHE